MLSSQTVYVFKPLQLGGDIDGKYCSRSRIMAWLLVLDKTASMLRDSGHQVFSEDLPGHGRDTTPVALCTLNAYLGRVCSTVESLSGPVVLVGHSMGGITISGVAERLPKNISELVYVAACLLRDGESIRSISASVTDSVVRENMLPAADWSTVCHPRRRAEGNIFRGLLRGAL